MGDEQKRYGATDDEIRKFCAKLYLRYGATDEDIVDWRRIHG